MARRRLPEKNVLLAVSVVEIVEIVETEEKKINTIALDNYTRYSQDALIALLTVNLNRFTDIACNEFRRSLISY